LKQEAGFDEFGINEFEKVFEVISEILN